MDLQDRRTFRRCPECSYAEQAWRSVRVGRYRRWGVRTKVESEFQWAGTRCPNDGNALVEHCDSCNARLIQPDDVACRSCGRRYWWRVEVGTNDAATSTWRSDENLLGRVGRISVYSVRQSLANIVADALISSDDALGAMRSRSASVLKRVGGEEIESDSMARTHELGTAWRTTPGRLNVRHVIHVAMLDADDATSKEVIIEVMKASLELADDLRAQSVGFPALGAGRSGFPMEQSAQVARQTIESYVAEHPNGRLSEIVFVLYSPEDRAEFRRAYEIAGTGAGR